MGCWCDNASEPLAGMLRPGSAGSNTAADHITVLGAAIAALPPRYRRRLMVTCDGAEASHDLIAHLDKLARRPGHQLIYSAGWVLGQREKDAITQVPEQAWQVAVDHRGEVRERRADDACTERGCAHRRCWVEEAHVTELTALLRQSRAGNQLACWPATRRVFARRERPHPGAQLTPLRSRRRLAVLPVGHQPARTHPRLARPARLHRRRPQSARTGRRRHPHRQRHRDRQIPQSRAIPEPRVIHSRADRRHPARLAAAARPRRRPRQSRAQDAALPHPARRRPPGAQRPPPPPQDLRDLALGNRDRNCLGPGHRPAPAKIHYSARRPSQARHRSA